MAECRRYDRAALASLFSNIPSLSCARSTPDVDLCFYAESGAFIREDLDVRGHD